ncbi:hypothetical protein [Pedobacter faecalis]|uniref:hypothetical protein n=1 Tax=Pedobacter faecalis TaxID=3041495 RepID=UPI00254A1B40|nr:hypothetical protein [Pedobacter sp. ELA7]
MSSAANISRVIGPIQYSFEFSVCTFVTRQEEYEAMLSSFLAAGFTDNTEFMHVDNRNGCTFDAYAGINRFLREARGKYIIICHQDILIEGDKIEKLRHLLKELDELDPAWGICGNAGAAAPNHVVYHITYTDGSLVSKGKLPLKVRSLDENFLLLKNGIPLNVSGNLSGFHMYGTDLCLHAEMNGYSAYVIPFNLTHKSRGIRDEDFYRIRGKLVKKYNQFFQSRWIQTNTTVFHLSGSIMRPLLNNPLSLFLSRIVNGAKKRMIK